MKKMELDDFYDLKHYSACAVCQYYKNKKCTNKQECIWNTLERKLKALEIIKEKRVDITFLDTYVKWNWEKYLNRKLKCSEKELTQDEFDLLKEVLL